MLYEVVNRALKNFPVNNVSDYKFDFFDLPEKFLSFDEPVYKTISKLSKPLNYKIVKNDNGSVINVEIPYADQKSIEVDVEDNVLKIKANKMSYDDGKESEEKSKYSISFTLNDNVDIDNIKAEYTLGVLRVFLTTKKEPEKNTKKIEVKF